MKDLEKTRFLKEFSQLWLSVLLLTAFSTSFLTTFGNVGVLVTIFLIRFAFWGYVFTCSRCNRLVSCWCNLSRLHGWKLKVWKLQDQSGVSQLFGGNKGYICIILALSTYHIGYKMPYNGFERTNYSCSRFPLHR